MQYTHLGRSGLQVSRLGLGTMSFGGYADEAESAAIMDGALDAGLNFFDTADVYGKGRSEELIGRWFAGDPGRREKVVLGTKLYIDMADWPNNGKLSALHIRRACDASLRRLQTDYIDLYQFHHIDRDTSFEEIWEAIQGLVQAGKIIYAGSSNFAGWHLAKANETARRRNQLGLVSEQSLYNLMERTVELEVLPAAHDYGIGVLPWSPLAGGLLAGAARKADEGRRAGGRQMLGHAARAQRIEQHRAALEEYEHLCDELGHKPSDVALAWLLAQPAVTAPVIGPRTLEQFRDSLGALDVTLPADVLVKLDELFPGPGGPAPEAYTW